jgi:hypothetical protein
LLYRKFPVYVISSDEDLPALVRRNRADAQQAEARAKDSGFRIQDSGFKIQDSGFRI